jgi:hypothetical protein
LKDTLAGSLRALTVDYFKRYTSGGYLPSYEKKGKINGIKKI